MLYLLIFKKNSKGRPPDPPSPIGRSGEENQEEKWGCGEGNQVCGNFIHPWFGLYQFSADSFHKAEIELDLIER